MSTVKNTISVVIPLYNKEQYIARAIQSVLSQTYNDFELIVVDDGSTDASAKVVEEFNDPRQRLIRQPNAGECAARNRGIAESRTELIAFLDADDQWLPEHLIAIKCLSEKYPECGAFATAYDIVDPPYHRYTANFETIPKAPWVGIIPNYFKMWV
ncbi:MAG: glycosyltransferase family A protein [Candidatus Electryonea clarkiae]|nr:glycosyltransferase family A protein [Candidatus Electryonea clarkiae]MDP8287894.1 glycosyltransferase family A protein [Candidatus Electryonea clarkiae]